MLDLEGATVTADAMHCQKETVQAIVDKDADYLLIVKGNQPTLQDALHLAIIQALDQERKGTRRSKKSERNRGREETREVIAMPCPVDAAFSDWASINTIGVIHRRREVGGQVEESPKRSLLSLPCKVRDIADRLRNHWSTENQQHHILDVTFKEDSSRIRVGTAQKFLRYFEGSLSRFCSGTLR